MLDEHQLAKREFVRQFFEEYRRRWRNIKSLHKDYPSEGLVLAYCFVEAMGYYRFGFGDTKLSSTEQFIKILFDYQENKHFFVIPPLVIKQLPIESRRRTIGREIKLELLQWLKDEHSESIGLRIDLLWETVSKEVKKRLPESEHKKVGHLYQICWAGWYYDLIRTAGVHRAHFPERESGDWETIHQAGESILENLRNECLEKVKFPHQLPQSSSIF